MPDLVCVLWVLHSLVLLHWLVISFEVINLQGSFPYQISCQGSSVNSSSDFPEIRPWHLSSNPIVVLNFVLTLIMEFDAEEFVGNPSAEELKAARVTKDQLKYIAANFSIQFTHDTKKEHLMTLILTHLGEEPITDPQSETTTSRGSSDTVLLLEVEKVKMQALQMKLDYERAEKEHDREHQLKVLDLQNKGHATQTPNKLQLTKILPLLPQFSDYLSS